MGQHRRFEPAAFERTPEVVFAWARAVAAGAPEPRPEVVAAVRREIGRLDGVAPEVLCGCVDAALVRPAVAAELAALQRWGVLRLLLPEVDAIVGFHDSCSVHHKDLWDHTLKVVAKIEPDPDLRWAALMHDAGKIATRALGVDGKVYFLRHEAVGARLFRGVAARLEMEPERAERVAFVVGQHGRANAYERSWSDRAVARLARHAGERLPDLLAFSRADWTTKRTAKASRILADLEHLIERLEALAARRATPRRFPPGLGRAVGEHLGVGEGKAVGAALAWLDAEIDAGRLAPGEPAGVYLAALDASQDRRPGGDSGGDQKG